MQKTRLAAAFTFAVLSAGSVAAAPAAYEDPLDAQTLSTIASRFSELLELANRHDLDAFKCFGNPFSPLVAKSAIRSEGNWAGFWDRRSRGSEAAQI
jgi:hypothetical protein